MELIKPEFISPELAKLLRLYFELTVGISVGFFLGRLLPKSFSGALGKGLYWVGVPILLVKSVLNAELTTTVLLAPVIAWIAILVGAMFALTWIDLGLGDEQLKAFSVSIDDVNDDIDPTDDLIARLDALPSDGEAGEAAKDFELMPTTGATMITETSWSRPTQGSFLLAMMLGNTAYLGFPVVSLLVGEEYLIWAALFNILGTTLGVHGLGFAIANRFGARTKQRKNLAIVLLQNPALWSCVVGVIWKLALWQFVGTTPVGNPPQPEYIVAATGIASRLAPITKTIVYLALVMIGMQLSRLPLSTKLQQASTCLVIKMLLVPLVVGTTLIFFDNISGAERLTLVLQMAMPPSFATVLYAQAYELDKDLSVSTAAFGTIALLFTLPIWVALFGASA